MPPPTAGTVLTKSTCAGEEAMFATPNHEPNWASQSQLQEQGLKPAGKRHSFYLFIPLLLFQELY